ncbi:hypothetical protein [Nocardia heshunensis]
MSFDPTGKSIDEILDYGTPGLQYWEHFLPLYAKAFGSPHGVALADLYARYDEQRGMDLTEFDTARAELDKAVADGETRWSAHQAMALSLPTAWTGATGTEALAVMNSQLRQSRDDLDAIRTAATTIGDALDPLRRAALTKAEHTRALLEPTPDGQGRIAIDGKSPADIEALDATDKWLTTTFRPDVDHKIAAFAAACDTTDQTVDSHYRTIITAFAQITDHPYPQPAPTLLPHVDAPLDPNPPAPQPTSITPPYASSPPDDSGGPAEPPRSGSPATRAGTPLETSPAQVTPAEPPAAQATAPAESTTAPAESTTPPAESATAPAVSEPAQSDGLTRTLKATLDQLETGLQQGVSTALEKLAALADPTTGLSGDMAATGDPKSGTDQPATPEHAPNPEHPADPQPPADPKGSDNSALPTGHLEFDLAGKHFALDRTPDGTMSLAITDESGHTQTWTLTLDESGKPTLAMADQPPAQSEANPAGADPNPSSATPATPPATGPCPAESPMPTPDLASAQPAAPPQPPCADLNSPRPPGLEQTPGVSAVCPAAPEPPLPSPNLDPPPPDSEAPREDPVSPPTVGPSDSACADAAHAGVIPDGRPASCAAPPESAVPTAPLGEAASPLPDVASEPAPEVHPLGGPDAAVEIPEGGIEIPEIP